MAVRFDAQRWRKRPGMAKLLDALGANEGLSRYVGGAVRDELLGLQGSDVDLATRLHPQEVVRRLEAAGIKAVPTGIEHGTITAVSKSQVVEVTTLRRDVSTDGRRATVAFTDDWKEDAARRDFTINALSADPLSGEIFDYFGGLADLETRTVRFIGDPLQRIAEDHLRILRFFRFHARFGGGSPDQAALDACTRRANDLMALSRERIADELLKLLGLPDPAATVALMLNQGILKPVLPEIGPDAVARLSALIAAEKEAGIAAHPLRHLAALLPRDPTTVEKVAARLKLSNAARKRLANAASTAESGAQALAYRLGIETAVDRLLMSGNARDAASIEGWPVPKLPISGGALIKRGLTEGPVVARTLRAIEDAWIAAGFPSGEAFEAIVAQALASASNH
ncbi:MAG: CCA tRNA nucleotidyltransferase [Sphingomicrobium sp.]